MSHRGSRGLGSLSIVASVVLAAGVAASQVTPAARAECFILTQPGARPYVSDAREC